MPAEPKSEFESLLEASPDAILLVDGQGTITRTNARCAELFGVTANDLVGRAVETLVPERFRGSHAAVREAFAHRPAVRMMGTRGPMLALRADGTEFPVEISLTPLMGAEAGRTVAIVRDIGERVRLEHALFAAKERAEVTLASIADGVVTTDVTGAVEYLNPVAEQLTGWSSVEARGRPIGTVLAARDETTGKACETIGTAGAGPTGAPPSAGTAILLRRDGREFSVELSTAPIRGLDGRPVGWVVVARDVTTQRRLALQLVHQASHDPLTGLVNRTELERRLARALVTAAQEGAQHAFCYLDLDRFKAVNDTCGHGAGDELLRQLAGVLRDHLRQRDTLARIGGDEFGLLLEHCPPATARRIAEGLRRGVAAFPFRWRDRVFRVGASIGLAQLNARSGTVQELLRGADAACYLAKARGRNQVCLARPTDSRQGPLDDSRWLACLRRALDEDGFRLLLQPIRPATGVHARPARWEVLLRLRHPSGRDVPPSAFLPVAERYGLTWEVDAWVLGHAVQALAAWQAAHPRLAPPAISINLGTASVSDDRLVPLVRRLLRVSGLPPSTLCFEITEAASVADLPGTRHTMRRLRRLGCGVALDQCGEGLGMLDYLGELPANYIKISGHIVRAAERHPVQRIVMAAIAQVGHARSWRCIAAAVESSAMLRRVRRAGIDFAQGHALGGPAPFAEALLDAVSRGRSHAALA